MEAVLSSETFQRSPALARLFRYLCEKYFRGDAGSLKEYSIAVEVLGRQPDFGEKRDSIVRVEVHRLRKKLREYYASEGSSHAVQVELKPGQYLPEFAYSGYHDPGEAEPLGSEAAVAAQPAILEPPAGPAGRNPIVWILALAGLVIALIVGVALKRSAQDSKSAQLAGRGGARSTAPGTGDGAIRIRAGLQQEIYIDRFGGTWSGDRYFQGGFANRYPFGTRELHRKAAIIRRAPDPGIFETFRAGTFSYALPLRPGNYELHLYFAETEFGPDTEAEGIENMRVFDVDANGQPLLHFFDVFSDAGGSDTADVKVFRPVRPGPDGFLRLDFKPVKDAPVVSAIEVVPLRDQTSLPIRIIAGGAPFIDRLGNVWSPDRYFENGRTVPLRETISGSQDQGLYAHERYGHFSYTVPVAPGRYTLTLYFAETHFGPSPARGGGGAGSRVFDVSINGVSALRNFDVFREAGSDKAVVKTFRGLRPNAQGKIHIQFDPVVNYAAVKAIEIVEEP